MKPKAGVHKIICSKCGLEFAEVTHYGGEIPLKECAYCNEVESECPNCWLIENN